MENGDLQQSYAERHPECIVLDHLDSSSRLIDRYMQYQQVSSCDFLCRDSRIIVPTFVELTTCDVEVNKVKLAQAGVTFPIVVKPTGILSSRRAHEMAIIFNKDHLQDVEAPCVAQSFLNHNALLYKIFVVGDRQFFAQRPSLKNMYPSNEATIFFDTHDVSKPGSSHPLNEIDADSIQGPLIKPDWQLLEQLGSSISQAMNMSLLGIDVIIDCQTQQYAIIDLNYFPGYEGVDDFFSHLCDHIVECLRTKANCDILLRTQEQSSTVLEDCTTLSESTANDNAKSNATNLKVMGKFMQDPSRVINCLKNIHTEVTTLNNSTGMPKATTDLMVEAEK